LGVFLPLQLLGIMWGEIVVKTLTGVVVGLITARQRQNPQQGLR
jgi:hypothetical protein